MQVYVVQSGDTLFSIANMYHTTIEAIQKANDLTTTQLIVGQSLVIPIVGQYYFVQPGDTLYNIAQRFGMSVELLARINQLPPNFTLPVALRLYIPPLPKRKLTTFGYIEPIGETVSPVLESAAKSKSPYLTFLAPFTYRVHRDGSLTPPPLNRFKEISKQHKTEMALVISNLEGDNFSSELAHIVLNVKAVQHKLIDEIVNIAVKEGFGAVHVDFEFVPQDDREAYNKFLEKLKPRLNDYNILLSTALAPKYNKTQPGLLYEAHDYQVHGEIADFVVLLTMEWGYQMGEPQAISPINEVEKVLAYALTEIPKEKILLGQNLYGYDWTLPFVKGKSKARAISPQQAVQIAREHFAEIEYDEAAQAPFFEYYDGNGRQHVVWFEDARSIKAKFDLVNRLELSGIAYWKLGYQFPQNWLLLKDRFEINKANG